MFFSHEVLTNPRSGVATVWLVATLGSKSNLKRVSRKAILDVDVPKACDTILHPEAPMALRLQGNLLYGVVRVHSQQCNYVLGDVQAAKDKMREMSKMLRTAELDPDAGKARPDQLVLPDDPAFMPEMTFAGLDFDLSALNLSGDDSLRSSLVSSQLARSLSHSIENGTLFGLDFGTSDTGGGEIEGLGFPGDFSGSARRTPRQDAGLDTLDEPFLADVDFEFDAEGNVVELPSSASRPQRAVETESRGGRDSSVDRRVREEHGQGVQQDDVEMAFDDGLATLGDDFDALPPIDELPDLDALLGSQRDQQADTDQRRSSPPSSDDRQSSSIVEARLRPAKRVLGPKRDHVQELRNADLSHWNTAYVENMIEAANQRRVQKATAQARKNGIFWVFGVGIGGVGMGIGQDRIKHPLDMFHGDKLLASLTNIVIIASKGRKRSRTPEEVDSSDSETRRVRARQSVQDDAGRGYDREIDNGIIMDDDHGDEVGRDAPAVPEDFSSQMPWNITASLHGSRQSSQARHVPSAGGFSSAGGPSSLPGIDIGRRGSRLISASPLLGRGPVLERLSSQEFQDPGDDTPGPGIMTGDEASDAFQLHGPSAAVDTQTAAQSQWIKATLDRESSNFLEFLRVEAKNTLAEDEIGMDGVATVTFEEVLPPHLHSEVVAAQGFHHVLALASKGLITVLQEEPYGDINVEVAVNA